MLIRAAKPGDHTGIARVHVESWRSTYRGLVPDDYLSKLSVEAREVRWARTLEDPARDRQFVLVAENAEGRIVGFANFGPQRERELPYSGELYAIYLLQEAQGLGVGRRLTVEGARLLQTAGYPDMLVWVLTTNPSRGFYERLGGQYITTKPVEIGGVSLEEAAYVWPDIALLTQGTAK